MTKVQRWWGRRSRAEKVVLWVAGSAPPLQRQAHCQRPKGRPSRRATSFPPSLDFGHDAPPLVDLLGNSYTIAAPSAAPTPAPTGPPRIDPTTAPMAAPTPAPTPRPRCSGWSVVHSFEILAGHLLAPRIGHSATCVSQASCEPRESSPNSSILLGPRFCAPVAQTHRAFIICAIGKAYRYRALFEYCSGYPRGHLFPARHRTGQRARVARGFPAVPGDAARTGEGSSIDSEPPEASSLARELIDHAAMLQWQRAFDLFERRSPGAIDVSLRGLHRMACARFGQSAG